MKYVVSDLHAQLFARALLEPGEQFMGKLMARHEPWYTAFLKFDFLKPYVLMFATDRRLILLEHRRGIFSWGYELTSIESIAWSHVEELAAKGLLAKNKVRLRAHTAVGPKRVTMNIAFWGALKKNGSELKNVVGTFQSRRSLPPGASTGPMMPVPMHGAGTPALQPSSPYAR